MTNLVLADHQPRRDHDCLVEPADDRQPLVRVRCRYAPQQPPPLITRL